MSPTVIDNYNSVAHQPSTSDMPATKSEHGTEEGNLADPIILNKIDQLFACGVGEYIALPQLVVVGDQSSGKSSVLEGLTKLPFPRDSGLCTRFATQITFRRGAEAKISVSIIPAKNASSERRAKMQEFREEGLTNLDADRFSSIMQKVRLTVIQPTLLMIEGP